MSLSKCCSQKQILLVGSKRESGAVFVETALVFVLLLTIIFGIVEVGHALYIRHRLNLIAEKTARQAIVLRNITDSQRTTLAVAAGAEADALPNFTLTSATVSAPYEVTDNSIVDYVIDVQIQGQYYPLLADLTGFNPIDFNIVARMWYEWQSVRLS